jgi:hypothetical protein
MEISGKMEAQQFCYWLQGFAELNNGEPPNDKQWQAIRHHLALVFEKKTPTVTYRDATDLKPRRPTKEYDPRDKVGQTIDPESITYAVC